jgi:hypothetical protein
MDLKDKRVSTANMEFARISHTQAKVVRGHAVLQTTRHVERLFV